MTTRNTDGTVTLEASTLHTMLTRVSPFQSTDTMTPVLCGARVFADGAELVAHATDRFTLGETRGKLIDDTGAPFSALISSPDVKRIVDMVKPARGSSSVRPIRLTLEGSALTVTDEWGSGSSMIARVLDGDYPRVSSLLTTAAESESMPVGELHLDPNYFVKLHKSLGSKVKHVALKMPANRHGAVLVTIPGEDDFRAILMPRRNPNV